MSDECAQAISIANHYFLLVDGMAPGFKDHLAEHVVLRWFGQVIKGRENVTAFMLSSETESFHTFPDIMPTSGISYESKRKIKRFLDQNANCETYTKNYLREVPAPSSHETEMSTTHESAKDCSQKSDANDAAFIHEAPCKECEFQIEKCKLRISTDCEDMNVDANQNEFVANAIAEMDDQSYDLNEKLSLCNLFEPEITSRSVVEKIQNINRIKLKEEMAPTIRAINRECGQGDGPVTVEANATKYLEANGEIKFVRMTKADSLFFYHWSKFLRRKFWKRQCRLQIAYSLLNDSNDSSKDARKYYSAQENACSAHFSAEVHHNADKTQKNKLPSLEEAIQVSNTLIRDVNHFGGYLQPLNFVEDREKFLKSFAAEIAQKNPHKHLCVHYVDNKLIFNFPNKRPFNVVFQIHEIVYSKVKVNEANET